jgi:glycosyltransferase involved in cell wall biosynthesis
MPEVSVVIPAYNAAAYLPTAIHSVLAQSFSDLEIIVVDDGSTDNTGEVVASFGSLIHYQRTYNSGPAAARNCGIVKSVGKYIAFLDADDWWLPHKLESQLRVLSQNPGMAFVCSDWFNGETGEEPMVSGLSGYKAWERKASFDLMLEENFVNTSTIVVEHEKLIKVGHFWESLRGAEDRHYWLRLLLTGDAFIVKEILAFRRFHPGNTSATLRFVESQVMMMDDVLKWPVVKANAERYTTAKSRYDALLVTLAYKYSSLGNYQESASIYKQLFLESWHGLPAGVRCVWFNFLGILKRLHLV